MRCLSSSTAVSSLVRQDAVTKALGLDSPDAVKPCPQPELILSQNPLLSGEVGTIHLFHQQWVDMGASQWALKVLWTGYRLVWGPFKSPLSNKPFLFPPPVSAPSRGALEQEVQMLLQKGAISPDMNQNSPGF